MRATPPVVRNGHVAGQFAKGEQPLLVITALRDVALRRADAVEARSRDVGHVKLTSTILDAATAAGRRTRAAQLLRVSLNEPRARSPYPSGNSQLQ